MPFMTQPMKTPPRNHEAGRNLGTHAQHLCVEMAERERISMLTFNVVSEFDGWGIHVERHMTSHFRSQEEALCRANLLAAAIRRHGVRVAVAVNRTSPMVGLRSAHP